MRVAALADRANKGRRLANTTNSCLLSLTCCHSFTNTFQRKRCSQAKVAVCASTGFGSPGCWSGCARKHGGCRALPEEHVLCAHQRKLKPRSWPTKHVFPLFVACKKAVKHSRMTEVQMWERGVHVQMFMSEDSRTSFQIAVTEMFKVWFTANWLFVVWLLCMIKMGHPCQRRQMRFCQTASKCFLC